LLYRELNRKPFPITPFKNSEPNSEVTALIQDELGVSDDEDVEYEPNEDEIHVSTGVCVFFKMNDFNIFFFDSPMIIPRFLTLIHNP
jgi:hypothetical protein